MRLSAILFVLAAGALTTVEAGANAQLTKSLHQPWWAAIAFGAITLVCLALAVLVAGAPFPGREILATPWWAWSGGVIAAVYAMSMLIFPERLGSAVFAGMTVTAAILASILLDHLGRVGFERHPAGLWRLVGAAVMVGGLALISIF
ncbi:MAG: DMT family transporter [Acidisphaera sp.]|nr:DMT family transporter [Acidisphaera sp.]